jgi:hypothetical protein
MSAMQPPDETSQQEPEQPTWTSPVPTHDVLSSTPSLPAAHDSTQPVVIVLMVVTGLLIVIGLLLRAWTGSSQPLGVAAFLSLAIVIGGRLYVWAASHPSRTREHNPIR